MKERIDFILDSIKNNSSLGSSDTRVDILSQNEYSFVLVVTHGAKTIRITTSLHHLDLPWELLIEVKSQIKDSISARNPEEHWLSVKEKYYMSPKVLNDDKELRNVIEAALRHNLE